MKDSIVSRCTVQPWGGGTRFVISLSSIYQPQFFLAVSRTLYQ